MEWVYVLIKNEEKMYRMILNEVKILCLEFYALLMRYDPAYLAAIFFSLGVQ